MSRFFDDDIFGIKAKDGEIGRLRAVNADLLAALKAALEMVDGTGAPPNWDRLRAVVAKAEDKP